MMHDLIGIVGKENVSDREVDKINYSKDLWPLASLILLNENKNIIENKPDLIVWPKNTEQVSKILLYANENKIPIIPCGAASGVCGGIIPINKGVILDLKKLNKVLEINKKSLTSTVQPGIIGQNLENILNKERFTLGHFPSSIYCSSLGGFLATRSAGQLSTKYGKIEDMALALEVVLPNGEIVRTTKTPRSAAGPNLNQLFIGSEGTLGIITESTLRIHKYPEKRIFRAYGFKDIHSGLETIRKVVQTGVKPAAVRFYDEKDTFLTLKALGYDATGFLLILCFEGQKNLTETEFRIASKIMKENAFDYGKEPALHWWNNRYKISYKLAEILQGGNFVDTIEVATTWDNLENLYYEIKNSIEEHCFVMAHFSHIYHEGGSIYFTFIGKEENLEESLTKYNKIWNSAMETCLKYNGTITHHHGIGLLKRKWFKKELGNGYEVLKKIKKSLDPNNIMNPGKLII